MRRQTLAILCGVVAALGAGAGSVGAAGAGLCSTAEAHQLRWGAAHKKLLRAWSQGNYERAALVAGSMATIAREALVDARSAPARTRSARAYRARIVTVHEGQRHAAALYVDAMIDGGAGRNRNAGRSYAAANATLLRAGFVTDYC